MSQVFKIVMILSVITTIAFTAYIDVQAEHAPQVYEPNYDDQQPNYAGNQIDQSNQGHIVDYHAVPSYSFNYAVHDPHTGDIKQHIEQRDGDVVKGSYSIKEADGSTRVVEYHADKHTGFNAKVHKIAANDGHFDVFKF